MSVVGLVGHSRKPRQYELELPLRTKLPDHARLRVARKEASGHFEVLAEFAIVVEPPERITGEEKVGAVQRLKVPHGRLPVSRVEACPGAIFELREVRSVAAAEPQEIVVSAAGDQNGRPGGNDRLDELPHATMTQRLDLRVGCRSCGQ